MRLTHIKLAGFKSFVDPTNVAIPGNLVGVVGPNGCGKSNIIDAVRWVLGETRASALRGESMQDVIFNGSSQRNPVGRASVELVFDNTLGRAAGQWSRYAEIAVKRVLQRDGDSAYFINNTQVRRRDVQDIFLGTGVGPRAYAIIEQGMISRVIEAKPEELRIFLEEAAGVSKYRERRRETENRLQDTRENLARVDDIRRELEAQLDKLTRQAEIARQYKDLQTQLQERQGLLWLLRKREAGDELTKNARLIEEVTNELEGDTARLREIERRLDQTRLAHYEASDTVNAAQGELYEVNSEVSRLEAEMRFIADTRQRLLAQGGQLIAQLAQWGRQRSELAEALAMWRDRHAGLVSQAESLRADATAQEAALGAFQKQVAVASAQVREGRDHVVELERALHLEEAHLGNGRRALARIEERGTRLADEIGALSEPSSEAIRMLSVQLAAYDEQLKRMTEDARSFDATLPAIEEEAAAAIDLLRGMDRERDQLSGRLDALRTIQAKVDQNESVDGWLERHGLMSLPRLWQRLRVESGWDAAVESVLRERLHALLLDDPTRVARLATTPPSARVTLVSMSDEAEGVARGRSKEQGAFPDAVAHSGEMPSEPGPAKVMPAYRPLRDVVHTEDAALGALLDDWIEGYGLAPEAPSANEWRSLPRGFVLVDRDGHQYRRSSVSFHADHASDTGIFARQREIVTLERDCSRIDEELVRTRRTAEQAQRRVQGAHGFVRELRRSEATVRQARHLVEIDRVRALETVARVRARRAQIEAEHEELAAQRMHEAEVCAQAEMAFARLEQESSAARRVLEGAATAEVEARRALDEQRAAIQAAERTAQEAAFAVRECESKLGEIDRAVQNLSEQIEQATAQEHSVRVDLGGLRDADIRGRLDENLGLRLTRESALADARARHDELTNQLRSIEEERLGCERRLGPLRERIAELRLKQQAAELAVRQFTEQLAEANLNEDALLGKLDRTVRPGALQAEITRISQAIQALGAINMAALEELATSQERKQFLDAQAGDLTEALGTLENAIRRIDRETRELMRTTFESVNENFSQLFPALFGGGEAKLVMTGEEILDCGIQVMAQPPGKRNTTIHLLSGGEKALTAISLVFSLFQLNPAPFCLLDEVDAPLDDTNTERFCKLVRKMSSETQFLFITHNKITMELGSQLIGVTMQEQGVSRIVAVDIDDALRMREAA